MNLQPLFSSAEIDESAKELKGKRFRKNFADLKRYSGVEERQLNSLGVYFKNFSSDTYWKALSAFSFTPYQGMKIKKSNGKFRPLLMPAPKDRIILAAAFPKIRARLFPELKKYHALGLGIKGDDEVECKNVLNDIQKALASGKMTYVLKLDFKDFFSSIDRPTLLKQLKRIFHSKKQRGLFRFIRASITNEIQASDEFWELFKELNLKNVGIPQGLAYSPLLASFYATPLDRICQDITGCRGYRYLDDMIILAEDEARALYAYSLIKKESEKLKLKLHPLEPGSKTRVVDVGKENFEFLGIGISKDKLFIPKDAIATFKKIFETEILNSSIAQKFSFQEIMKAYKPFAAGWSNHYRANCPKDYTEIEAELNAYLGKYIEKNRARKKLFGQFALTLQYPFLKTL